MPQLDRRIVVRRLEQTINDFGEAVETFTDHGVWAGVADLSAFDTEAEGGIFTAAIRKWRIRWRADFAGVATNMLSVVDEGHSFNVTNVVEQRDRAERRRFMEIEGVAITGELEG